MTTILRATLFAAFAATCIPAVAAAQGDTSTASLRRRIDILERANADLERRVRELEAVIKSASSEGRPIPASTRWRDLANWRRLRLGMSMDEVRVLLGEPDRVEASIFIYWRWTNANVYFLDGKLKGWSEPDRL